MSERTRRAGGWLGTVVAVLFLFGGGFWCVSHGGSAVWAQQSGISASVETTHCKAHRQRGSGWLPYECTAVWRQADGSDKTVTVRGVPRYGPRQILDVHIRGDRAYTNSFREGWGNLLAGIVLLVLGIVVLLPKRWIRALRRSRNAHSGEPDAPPGPHELS
jgi:hypothetical protein